MWGKGREAERQALAMTAPLSDPLFEHPLKQPPSIDVQ
jgi:hypothetical protein